MEVSLAIVYETGFAKAEAAGILLAKTITDLHLGKMSVGLKPSGASANLPAEAMPQRSAPRELAVSLTLDEFNETDALLMMISSSVR
jgi:hypothetical protein